MSVHHFNPKRARRDARRLRLVDDKFIAGQQVNAEVRELLINNKQPERELVKEVHMFEPMYPTPEPRREWPLWLQCLGAIAAGIAAAVLLASTLNYFFRVW